MRTMQELVKEVIAKNILAILYGNKLSPYRRYTEL